MKLKLTMTNAETGEVLREENNIDFAMMCFGHKTDEGVVFHSVTRGENMTATDIAHCLFGVDGAVEKTLRNNKAVSMAYTLVKLGVLGGDRRHERREARPGDVATDAEKEGEQG